MERFKRLLSVLLVIVFAISVAACTPAEEDVTPPDATGTEAPQPGTTEAAGEPAEGGEDEYKNIVFQMATEPDCMDPTMNDYANGSMAIRNLFVGLVKYAPDGTIVPACAEKWELSDDLLTYTFHLRDGLKWSDGTDLTAADFEYAIKRMVDPLCTSEAAYTVYDIIKNGRACYVDGTVTLDEVGVKAIDEKTLQIELAAPIPYALHVMTAWMPIRKDMVDQYGDEWAYKVESYICNGPYMLTNIVSNDSYTFVKNPNYYSADTVDIDEVKFVFLGAAETALLAFENGEVDAAVSVNADALAKYVGTENLDVVTRPGFRYYEFNSENLTDSRVRRALSMSINREVLVSSIILDPSLPTICGFIPYGIPDVLDGSKSWREVHGEMFTEDIAAAQQLLAEAGYPGGEGLTIRLLQTNDATLVKVAQAMAQMWEQNLGITVEIVTVESGVYWDAAGPRDMGEFEVCFMGYTGDFPDPLALLQCFENSSGDNAARWINDEYNALIAQLNTGISGEEREAVCEQCEAILAEEMPVMPVYSYTAQTLVSSRLGGFVRINGGAPLFEYAYIVGE